MRRRVLATAGAAALGAATAVAALAFTTTAGFAETTTSSAYGVKAVGAIPFEPTPYVESTDGTTKTSSALDLPPNPLLKVGVAHLSAGDDEASVELLRVGLLPDAALPPELEPLQDALGQLAEALAPLCQADPPALPVPELGDLLPPEVIDALDPDQLCEALKGGLPSLLEIGAVNVHCKGDTGGVTIADLKILGQEVPIPDPPAFPEFPENPLLGIAFNKQVKGDDGSFSVTGVEINLGDGAEVISLGNATCGATDDDDDDDDDDDPTAEPPTPVTTGLPVTG